MSLSELICRFCLKTVFENYLVIEDALKDNMQELLKSDLYIVKESVLCKECHDNLQGFHKFKNACAGILVNNFQAWMTCCFCTKKIENGGFLSLKELKENTVLVDMLQERIPALDLNIIRELFTCETCLDALQGLLDFLMNCLDVEEKIRECRAIDQMELNNIQFMIQSNLNEKMDACDNGGEFSVKLEAVVQEKETDDINLSIKTENADVKLENDDVYIKTEHNDSISFQATDTELPTNNGIMYLSQQDKREIFTEKIENKKYVIWDTLSRKNPPELTVYKCEQCTYVSKCKSSFSEHNLAHKSASVETAAKCKLCSYETTYNRSFKQHMLTHENKMYKCKKCEGYIKVINWCRSTHINLAGEIVDCLDILSPYETTYNTYPSKGAPAEATVHKCETCSFETTCSDDLNKHKTIHKKLPVVKVYKCELCIYEAKQRATLARHMFNHKNSSKLALYRGHKCIFKTKCKSSFIRLVVNDAKSAGPYLYKCKICELTTNNKDDLNSHLLSHKGVRDISVYKCRNCPYVTKHRNCLKSHVIRQHKNCIAFHLNKCIDVNCVLLRQP